MPLKHSLSRRSAVLRTLAGFSSAVVGSTLPWQPANAAQEKGTAQADPKIRGPFPILSTPFTDSGEVDYGVLAKEAKFVSWGGCPGMIWPQSGDSIDLLTMDEKMKGMEVLAETARSLPTSLCLGVQGKDTEEMLAFAAHAEKLQPEAIISRPPDSGKSEEDLRQYWRSLAAVVNRPVILQTTGGVHYKGPIPSPELMIELAKEFPHFGYIKEEAGDVLGRMRTSVAAMPPVRRVFSARGGFHWLKESQLGSEGVITERAAYADVLTRIWELQQSGEAPKTLEDVFNNFIQMVKVKPGSLRGANLFIWKKRGVFKNLVSRDYGPQKSIPPSPIVSELKLDDQRIAEIEERFGALRPYLNEETPDLS
ncbi:4-hydroxy-tetrahydrodipicolinate synthase [Rubripirellula lacrimiformis]|uniref:4-hydroxy-tetrahydrodipicolinate synthase n=1 Tax=Rubripirellula lacrimiformis TaxID=1930273 RepID=A0A517N564_9BACT|nr:dihydrodipicolinate synthase family protein [Rubripirellula lacrimiformis]QDT02270.1 4-hydroxy-tetrahydrodipicolinate synthase [Rubripirellula lacrimiformis]